MLRRFLRSALVLAAVGTLGACAPVAFSPVGFNLGGIPGVWGTFSQCAGLANASPEAARMGIRTSPAIQAFAVRNQIQQIQARLSSGYDVRNQMEGWKRAASGDC